MRLTRYTDFALRVLLYLGRHPGELASISEISRGYSVSQSHLMKVVSDLVGAGYVESVRGRHGGIRLARPPAEISIGALVRHTEADFDLVECGSCRIAPACGMSGMFGEALDAFLAVLDGYTLADALGRKGDFSHLLFVPDPAEEAIAANTR